MAVGVYVAPRQSARAILGKPSIDACFPATLYLFLSLADLCCSLVAFRFGVAEGNPFMGWLVSHGLFVPGKLAISLLVAGLMAVVYNTPGRARLAVWAGVGVMVLLDMYHLWALPQFVGLATFGTIL